MIRSSLESKLYILQRSFSSSQSPGGAVRKHYYPGCFVSAPERPSYRAAGAIAVVVLVLLGFIIYRARGSSFDWNLFLETMRHVSWAWLMFAILLMLLTYVGRAIRWEVMLRPLGRPVTMARLTSDTCIGFMAATVLGRVGEFVRPYLIALSAGVSVSSQIAAWALERLLDIMAVLLIFGFALVRIPAHTSRLSSTVRWALSVGGYVAAAVAVLCLALFFAFRNLSQGTRDRLVSALGFLPARYSERVVVIVDAFMNGVQSTRDPGLLLLLALFTGMEWALILASYIALLRSFTATAALTITDGVIVLAFVAFGSIFQIPGIGGGVQVTSIVVLTQIYGLSLESATGIALFIWILTLVVIVPAGLACAFHRGLNWRKIRQLAANSPAEEQHSS